MTRTMLRADKEAGTWCAVEITLEDSDKGPRLSISGTAGRLASRADTAIMALDYWEGFFEDSPSEIIDMAARFDGFTGNTAKSAAQFVVDTDGNYHGMDVHRVDGDTVYLVDSCGQIRDEISTWFPEVYPYFAYHLNDMHAGCEHQDVLGWGHGRDVALAPADMTPAQLDSLQTVCTRKFDAAVKREFATRVRGVRILLRKALRSEIDAKHAHLQTVKAEVFTDSLGAPCPDCGYRYGTQWLKRDLPESVIAWAQGGTA